jgi:hypothetical protein
MRRDPSRAESLHRSKEPRAPLRRADKHGELARKNTTRFLGRPPAHEFLDHRLASLERHWVTNAARLQDLIVGADRLAKQIVTLAELDPHPGTSSMHGHEDLWRWRVRDAVYRG